MKNIKSVVLTLIVMLTISVLVAGCNKKDDNTTAKKETTDTSKPPSQTMKTDDQKKEMSNSDNMNSSNKSNGMEMIKLPSMQCNICKKNIETAVGKVAGVSVVKVDKDKKIAHVEFDKSKTDLSKIEDAITAAGYDANGKKKDMKAYDELDECCKVPEGQKEKK